MTGLTGDSRYGGSASEELDEKKQVVRKQELPTVHVVRTLKNGSVAEGRVKRKLEGNGVQLMFGRTEEVAKQEELGIT